MRAVAQQFNLYLYCILTIRTPCTACPPSCTSPAARRCVGASACDIWWPRVLNLFATKLDIPLTFKHFLHRKRPFPNILFVYIDHANYSHSETLAHTALTATFDNSVQWSLPSYTHPTGVSPKQISIPGTSSGNFTFHSHRTAAEVHEEGHHLKRTDRGQSRSRNYLFKFHIRSSVCAAVCT